MTEISKPTPTAGRPSPIGPDEASSATPALRTHRSRLLLVLQGLSLGVVACLLGLLVWKVVFDKSGAQLVAAIKHGRRPVAPAFRLGVIWPHTEYWPVTLRPALDDGVVSLYELRGHPVVINFWASWCVPCRDEAPNLNAAAKAHAGRVVFLGIDIQDLVPDAHKFLRELHVPYVSVRDKSSGTYRAYGLTGVPETYYLDRQGRIVGHSIGAVSGRELEQQLAPLLADAPPG
ncbi:MAG: TlpA family protein disulfide reductase [Actinobacteria bacterium]|nr:MAG: TlpA family protein disulfide reductase [Actinomycetota bacterium]